MTVPHYSQQSGPLVATAEAPRGLSSGWMIAVFFVLSVALVGLTARDALANILNRWWGEEEYGYGFVVVALVPVFLWRRWQFIQALSNNTRWPGLALVFSSQLIMVLGALGESYFVEQIAVVTTLLGLALLAFGTGPFRVFLPLALLMLLTIPLPYTLQAMVTVELQLFSTKIGVAFVRFFGIPVFVEGNIIDLGQYKLQVAEACSGLRYLLPLTCLSFLAACLYKAPLWKRAFVVISATPITILINSFRIAMVAVLVDNFGIQMAEGFIHDFEGWIVFLIGAILIVIEIVALEKFRLKNVKIEWITADPVVPTSASRPSRPGASAIVAVVVCALAFSAVTAITWASDYGAKPERQEFAGFPRQIGDWSGREGKFEPDVLAALKATDLYTGDFSEATNKYPVNLFVAYYDSLNKGAAIHSPRVCLPSGGWEFASFEEKNFEELEPGALGTFNRVLIRKGNQQSLMYYWFQQRERRTANEFGLKYYILMDGLTKNRKDGALVRLYTPIIGTGDKGILEADERLKAFARVAIPKLNNYLPK